MRFLLSCLLLLSLPSHAQDARPAALADIGTTALGLALGAAEANSLGIATVPLKFALISYADTLPDGEKQEAHAALSAAWTGAAVNNVCVIAAIVTGGAFAPACVAIGLATVIQQWQASAHERQFWVLCSTQRKEQPNLRCTYTTPG